MKKIYYFLLCSLTLFISQSGVLTAQTWTKINDFNGDARLGAVSFIVGGNAYIGLGKTATVALNDLWKYNSTTDSWTAVASFPGAARLNAVAFVVNGKAYVGSGTNSSYSTVYSNFYAYNPTDNTWSAIADLPQTLTSAVAFAIGNYGYVGLGTNGTNDVKTFYKYDPSNNTWTATGIFSGDAREGAQAGVINDKGYVIGGVSYDGMTTIFNDVQEYNPVTNTWTEKVFANSDLSYSNAATYVLGGKIHLCYGNKKLIRTYTPSGNAVNDLGVNPVSNVALYSPIAFTLGENAYFGLGEATSPNKDIYKYSPPAAPTPQASNILFSEISSNSTKISWTSGGGSKRVIFMKKTDQVETPSIANSTSYAASSTFGSGNQIGTSGWYCIYNGSDNFVNVSGLTGNSTYRAMVCEYSGNSGEELYNTTSTSNNIANAKTFPTALSITGSSSYCAGTTPSGITFNLNNSELSVNYQLKKDNQNYNSTITGTGNTISWTNLAAGQYTLSGTNSAGTSTMTGTFTVTEKPLVTVTITISANKTTLASNEQVSISSSITNGGNSPIYKWYINQIEKGTNSSSHSYGPTNGDKVYCILNSSESCVTSNNIKSNEITLTVTPSTGVDENSVENYKIYPNPVENNLYIDFEKTLKPSYIEIFSLDGKSIFKKFIGQNEHQAIVDVSNIPSGIYFIKAGSNQTIKTKRFVKR